MSTFRPVGPIKKPLMGFSLPATLLSLLGKREVAKQTKNRKRLSELMPLAGGVKLFGGLAPPRSFAASAPIKSLFWLLIPMLGGRRDLA